MSLVVRGYNSRLVHESFLHFEAAKHLDAGAVSEKEKIIQYTKLYNYIHIDIYGLDYKSNLVGQEYDKASVKDKEALWATRVH